jgi:hypothetical protein
MTKKKEIRQIFENLELESSEAHPQAGEPVRDQAQSANILVGDEEKLEEHMLSAEELENPAEEGIQGLMPNTGNDSLSQSEQESDEETPDNLLDDVRRSLFEEEAQEEKDQKWWRRLGRSSKRKEAEDVPPQVQEEINLPALSSMQAVDEESDSISELETGEYQEQISDLIDMLDTEEEPSASAIVVHGAAVVPVPQPEVEPERPIDIVELKKHAFQSRAKEADEENLTEVRTMALEGDEEVFVEVEAKSPDQLEERISAVENALKPYQRYLNFAFAFLGIVMAVVAAFLIYNVYQRSVAKAAPTEIPSNLPFPTAVGLPGGWQFALGKGSLTADGSWNPAGAEWLQGTEVCRWVALPWSRQLEAVIRTLNPNDPIQLGMSNNDQLKYNVYSVQQMSPAQMLKLDANKPCLLIVLAEPDAEKRWVLTALP